MDQITVNELLLLCKQAVREGHGEKNIVISDDNEGNGFHGLFSGFTLVDEGFTDIIYDSKTTDAEHTIILG